MNLHISEILSEITEPVVEAFEGGNEVISTEDFKARIEVLNEENLDWTPWKWWEGKRTNCGKYEACARCVGDEIELTCEVESGEVVTINEENLCKCVERGEVKGTEDWEDYWNTEEGSDATFWTDEETWKKKWRNEVKRTSPNIIQKLRKMEWSKKYTEDELRDENKIWKSCEVLEEEIQDFNTEMVIIGCDVESLYPSLDKGETSRIVGEEMLRSEIVWEDLDYLEGARLIALNRSADWCRTHELRRVLPTRRGKTGSRPGVTGKGPAGPYRGDQEQWRFPVVTLTEKEKRMIVAEVTRITTEVMFDHHLYTFGGQVYKQRGGGPIGLRGTCAIARLVMCNWDRVWKDLMEKNCITLEEFMRYMDDGRVFLHPLKPGWRWVSGELQFTLRWREEDKHKSGLEITRTALDQSMQEVIKCLRFTTEVGEGEELWLPTLDIQIRVEKGNRVSYQYFEKPTTTNVTVQKRTALEENTKNQILANELMRRLGNTDREQNRRVKSTVIDQFATKLLTSGYSLNQTRRITLNGVRGWEKRRTRALQERSRLFRTAGESRNTRIKKRTIGKTSWFKKRRNKKAENKSWESNYDKEVTGENKKYTKSKAEERNENKKDLRTVSVLFVENTKDNILAKMMREVVERIQGIMGYRVKVVERGGTPLKMMFPLTQIGEGKECGREDCVTCTQESRGEKLPPCKKRSVLYENICLKCNPGVGEKNHKLNPPEYPPSVYVGESSRSLYERGLEHWKGFKNEAEDSHIFKHHTLHHGGEGTPAFHLRPIKFTNTALSRQLSEAVRIERVGEERLLNSKAEYNRCKVSRLTLGEEDKPKKSLENGEQGEEDDVGDWERGKTRERRIEELSGRVDLKRGLAKSYAKKRGTGEEVGGRSKRKYPLLGEDWGESNTLYPPSSTLFPAKPPEVPNQTPPSPKNIAPLSPAKSKVGQTDTRPLQIDNEDSTLLKEVKEDDKKEEVFEKEDDLKDNKLLDNTTTSLHQIPARDQLTKTGGETTKPPPTKDGLEVSTLETTCQNDNPIHHIQGDSGDTEGEPRVDTCTSPPQLKKSKQIITIDNYFVRTTSVNKKVVDIRVEDKNKKTTTPKKKTTKKTTLENKKKMPATPSSGKITNYVVKKIGGDVPTVDVKTTRNVKMTQQQEDNLSKNVGEDNDKNMMVESMNGSMIKNVNTVKTTFAGTRPKGSLGRLQKSGMKDECVLVGGKCRTHGVKLYRSCTKKKMSVVGKDGSVKWVYTDVTCLLCPTARPASVTSNSSSENIPDVIVGTNKRRKIINTDCVDQSPTPTLE